MSIEHPALGECIYCRAEIVWGSLATALDRELPLCGACPPTAEERAAMVRSVDIGRRATCSEPAPPFTVPGVGYTFGSREWVAAKRGWWAGAWVEQKDHALDNARASLLGILGART